MSEMRAERWKLTFDAARCDGWGMCSVVFPEGISLDPWGFADVTKDPVMDRKLVNKARRAAACCPKGAIRLSEDMPLTSDGYSRTAE